MGPERHHDPHAERLLTRQCCAHPEPIAPAYHLVSPAGIQITLSGITPPPHPPPDVGVTRIMPTPAPAPQGAGDFSVGSSAFPLFGGTGLLWGRGKTAGLNAGEKVLAGYRAPLPQPAR